LFAHAARVYELSDRGKPGPVLEVRVRAGDWQRTTYLPQSGYEHLAPQQLMELPGQRRRAIWLGFSRRRLPLPATVQITDTEYQTQPGSVVPKDYICDLAITAGGEMRRETITLDRPVHVGPFQLNHGSWRRDPAAPTQITFGAATRPGLPLVWIGGGLVCIAFPYAFYVKPLALRRRRRKP
jgi:hypothetical protein